MEAGVTVGLASLAGSLGHYEPGYEPLVSEEVDKDSSTEKQVGVRAAGQGAATGRQSR